MHARGIVAVTVGAFASGCAAMSGPVVAPGQGQPTGVEFHALATAPYREIGPGGPNVASISYRQTGGDHKTSFALGWMETADVGRALVYGRFTVELVGREHLGAQVYTRTLSPTFEIGIAPFGHGGCVSVAGTWDVRFGGDSQGVIGAFFGWCGVRIK